MLYTELSDDGCYLTRYDLALVRRVAIDAKSTTQPAFSPTASAPVSAADGLVLTVIITRPPP